MNAGTMRIFPRLPLGPYVEAFFAETLHELEARLPADESAAVAGPGDLDVVLVVRRLTRIEAELARAVGRAGDDHRTRTGLGHRAQPDGRTRQTHAGVVAADDLAHQRRGLGGRRTDQHTHGQDREPEEGHDDEGE